jgi:hypothetical protein
VKALDGDEGENAMIRYELVRSPYGDVYELDRHSGVIRMRRKPDGVGQHEITIKAYDGAQSDPHPTQLMLNPDQLLFSNSKSRQRKFPGLRNKYVFLLCTRRVCANFLVFLLLLVVWFGAGCVCIICMTVNQK